MHALLATSVDPQPVPVRVAGFDYASPAFSDQASDLRIGNAVAESGRKFTILLIEKDMAFAGTFASAVSACGFDVEHRASLQNVKQTLRASRAQLIAIGSVTQAPDNFSICREIREISVGVPIIWLQSGDDEFDQALMIELGADVCISKTAHHRVIVAQLKSLRRRLERDSAPNPDTRARPSLITHGRLQISPASFQVRIDGKPVSLPTTLFQTFLCLVNRANEVITRKDFNHVDQSSLSRSIDTQVNRLRRRLRQAGLPSDVILSAHGQGYVFVSDRCNLEPASEG